MALKNNLITLRDILIIGISFMSFEGEESNLALEANFARVIPNLMC